VGMEQDTGMGADGLSPSSQTSPSSSVLGRLGSRLSSSRSSVDESIEGGGMLEVSFGASAGDQGGSGLYLSSD
jgi:hypothetical protein